MKRILYCNPVFFEYRLPFYLELNRLFCGNFYVLYSPLRYKMCGKDKFCETIKQELGENAIELTTDHLFDTNSMKWDVMPDIEKGKRIPFTYGIFSAINKIRPDVLITEGYFQWTPLILLYGRIHGIPVYMGYERTCWTERNAGWLKTLQRKLFNPLFAGFIVNGSETRRYLESLGVSSSKIQIGGMSADSVHLRNRLKEIKFAKTEKSGCLNFLFSGVVAERKGLLHLLDAWKSHIQVHSGDTLTIVGDGNQLQQCKDMAKGMASVLFVGRVPYEKIAEYYAGADVYILPTIEDNWSLVIPEAMACGLPVATSIYNGCYPELIKEGVNGWTFDTFKHDTIIDVLDKFHHADLKAMGEASIRIEEPFNALNSAQRVYDVLK